MLAFLFRDKLGFKIFPNGRRRPIYIFSLVFIFLLLNQRAAGVVSAYQETQWSPVQTIPSYQPDTWPPILIADQNRTVHAFSYQWVPHANRAIVYNQWTKENGWTPPLDIVISPEKEARLADVYLDEESIFHLVYWGGDNTNANIYYSKAPAAAADNAYAWSDPVIIGENAGDPESAAIAEDDQDILHVLYNGRDNGGGIYEVTSENRGGTWSNPIPVFFADDQAPLITGIRMAKSEEGNIHAIWNTRTLDSQGRGLYYSNMEDDGRWKEPILLDQAPGGYGINNPTIQPYGESLFVIYFQTPKLMMRLSKDNGLSWDRPIVLFPRHVGVNGSPSLVVDGDQGLHLFFGQRIDATPTNPEIHGLWHSTWIENRWTEPEAVVKGPPIQDDEGDTSFDPFEARAIVSQANTLLATWRTDPGNKGNGVWYSYKTLDIPAAPVVPLPTAQIQLPDTTEEVASLPEQANSAPTMAPTPKTVDFRLNDSVCGIFGDSPFTPIVIGILSSIIIILIVARLLVSDRRR